MPDEATRSVEADLAFFDDPDDAKADAIDGAIGELSRFHETYGYYAQGVSIQTAVLPIGWKDRLVRIEIDGGPTHAYCLDPHDCVVSKLVAYRPKDLEFGSALIRAGLVDPSVLIDGVQALPRSVADTKRQTIVAWIRRHPGTLP